MRVVGSTLLVVAVLGCGGDAGEPLDPAESLPVAHGSLEVITTPAGPGMDADGYQLGLNGITVAEMAPVDTLRVASLASGPYGIGLDGVAPHCKVGGANPRGIRLEPGRTTRVVFVVKCDPAEPSPDQPRS